MKSVRVGVIVRILTVTLLWFLSSISSTSFADVCDVRDIIHDGCNDCTVRTLKRGHCESMKALGDILYDTGDWVKGSVIQANKDLVSGARGVDVEVGKSALGLVDYYLSGLGGKKEEGQELAKNFAGNLTSTSYTKSVFFPGSPVSSYSEAIAATASSNALLGPLGYRDAEKKQQTGAQLFIRYLEGIVVPPKIVNISQKFKIDFSPNASPDGTEINFGNNAKNFAEVQQLLVGKYKELYDRYKANYFSSIAVRTMLLNNFLQMYQRRVVQSGGDGRSVAKSAAELDYESATWRLTDEFYKKIIGDDGARTNKKARQPASPAVVQREILFVLAEIRHDLYRLRQQNELLTALQSLNGLQLLALTKSNSNKVMSGKIEQIIYCNFGNNSSGDYCKKHKEELDPNKIMQDVMDEEHSALPGSSSAGTTNSEVDAMKKSNMTPVSAN